MKEIIFIGAGGHSHSLIDIVESSNEFRLAGFVDQKDEKKELNLNYPVVGNDQNLEKLRENFHYAFIAIGQIKSSFKRQLIAKKLKNLNYIIPILKSHFSIISKHSELSCGVSVGHGAIVNAGVRIGKHTIINSNALIEHDCIISDFCHISTGAIINGNVKIGFGSFIGSGAIIREGIELPPYTIIGAGKVIMGWPQK